MPKIITIEDVKEKIKELHPGSICNFNEYKNNYTKLSLICENNHKFEISYHCIQKRVWCAECIGNKKLTIEYVKKYINEKHQGAICNSDNYKNSYTKLDLICENNHEFKMKFASIHQGQWCAKCAGVEKHTIEYVKEQIMKLHPGSICNFNEYKNAHIKLDLICENKHEFKIRYHDVQQGIWCAECAGVKKYTIEYIKEQIEKLHPGSICKSNKYKNAHSKLELVCENNHNFKINYHHIRQGFWCAECFDLKSEKYIKSIFEKLTGKLFTKTRPEWLINNKTNYKLELDGYNEEINIAFECQGIQHYKLTKRFHKNKNDFKYQQYRDNIKKELCEKNGVKLICVPAIMVKINNVIYTKKLIEAYIEKELNNLHILI